MHRKLRPALPSGPRLVHSGASGGLSQALRTLARQMRGEGAMRDIRIDLQERARLIEDQISASYAQFEKMIEQLQSECESRVSELKSEVAALSKLMDVEHRRMANVLPLATQAPAPQAAPGQQLSLSDFIM